jgi:transposase
VRIIPLVLETGRPMARRTFDVIDICEIFEHWHAGRSKNEIAGSLGLSRNTVRKYVAAAEAAGMRPGGPAVAQLEWARLAREWFPELADTRLRQVTWPAIGEHRDYIVAQLEAKVTVATIHQRLRDERGRYRWLRCAAMWRRTCPRRSAGRRCGC